MGRPKNFSREEILQKSIPIFWNKGFADTSLQDLEQATGVNKSGLYSEFESKEELFLETLRYYLKGRGGSALLKEPLGWQNIRSLLRQSFPTGKPPGCLAVYSLRELSVVPDETGGLIEESLNNLKSLVKRNLKAVSANNPDELADMILTFFKGLCLEQNLEPKKTSMLRKIDSFVDMLESVN